MDESLFKQRSRCRDRNPGLTTLGLNRGREDSLGKPQRRELSPISPLERNSESQSWRCEATTRRKPEEKAIDSTLLLPPDLLPGHPVGPNRNQRTLGPHAYKSAYWVQSKLEKVGVGLKGPREALWSIPLVPGTVLSTSVKSVFVKVDDHRDP